MRWCLNCQRRRFPERDCLGVEYVGQVGELLPTCECASPRVVDAGFDPVRQRLIRASAEVEEYKPIGQLGLGEAA